jgi:hypothetical protein
MLSNLLDKKKDYLRLVIFAVALLSAPALSFSQNLETYSDPKGEFSIQYDPSIWAAIPDTNRFDPVLMSIADVETGGDMVAVTIGKYPGATGDVESLMRLALPNYEENQYNFELLEPIECQAYNISGQKTCTFIYTEGFNKYEDIYKMINFKTGEDLWIITFLAPGDTYDSWEAKLEPLLNTFRAENTTSY